MKKIIILSLLLFISLALCVICFVTARHIRGYNALGGEVFIIALPLMIITKLLKTRQNLKWLNQH